MFWSIFQHQNVLQLHTVALLDLFHNLQAAIAFHSFQDIVETDLKHCHCDQFVAYRF